MKEAIKLHKTFITIVSKRVSITGISLGSLIIGKNKGYLNKKNNLNVVYIVY